MSQSLVGEVGLGCIVDLPVPVVPEALVPVVPEALVPVVPEVLFGDVDDVAVEVLVVVFAVLGVVVRFCVRRW